MGSRRRCYVSCLYGRLAQCWNFSCRYESRIKTWKNDWAIVYDILKGKDNSSFGWDEHKQMVVTEDAVWNSYISSYKEADQFKHNSFPYYDQLTSIYAKDR
ncbi:hypothetical protein Goari_013778, partial [Gossypium aridum]|nr:hypothetical protein [Gossypium aridum]